MKAAGMTGPVGRGIAAVVCALLLHGIRLSAADKPAPAAAAATRPAQPPKTGYSSNVKFTDRSPLSAAKETSARMGWAGKTIKGVDLSADYKLEEESFEVYVPASYTGERAFGLVVFASPSPSGGLDPLDRNFGWQAALDKHELIWVGANNAGNDRSVFPRLGLPIDAAANVQARYRIDPQRVYIAGISGGGRIASMLAVACPDVFRGGGFYMIGCNFYRVEKSKEKEGVYQASFYPPPPKVLAEAKRSKHVFLTGDTDPNRDQTQVYYEAFQHDGFAHCTYLQVPHVGHQPPPREWFEKGIEALDAPADATAAAAPQTRPAAAPGAATRPALAAAATRPAGAAQNPPQKPAPEAPSDADRLFAVARIYADNRLYDRAREKLQEVIQKYPRTPAAEQAKKLLNDIRDK
jgi:predicted esterase